MNLRLLPSIALSVVVAFGLFMLMAKLIDQEIEMDDKKRMAIPDIMMTEPEINDIVEEEKPEKPEEPDQPPPDLPEPEFQDPDLDAGLNTSGAGTGIELGFDAGGLNVSDGEYLPIVKVAPQYPRRAQSRGIEGYAIAQYTVTESGTTEDCVVIEAATTSGNPTTIFNSAACRAAAKFKYRPRVVDGVAIKVPNVRNRFTFEFGDD
ncbi:energy transducer TonB [uncultured Umboniibacter sp.]|uniref:energy transducer TonB n=1 Tax=uncultured Umboniibacter sp. TaxID=1798917 RepID=UPI0026368755|nr:energy transducer TonB [uncultured Umboniibacter sp.]